MQTRPARRSAGRFLRAGVGGLALAGVLTAVVAATPDATSSFADARVASAPSTVTQSAPPTITQSALRTVSQSAVRTVSPSTTKPATYPAVVSTRKPAVVSTRKPAVVATTKPTPVPVAPPPAPAVDATYGCGPALQWLTAHAAPGFRLVCPGYAMGHQAMTCQNTPGVCPNSRLIVIADPCAAAYKNEAHNSWIIAGLTTGTIDPYGFCSN